MEEDKRKDKKPGPGRLFRRRSLRSVGSFVNRIFRTLGTFAHFGDADAQDADEDDGGFRTGAPGTLSASCGVREEVPDQNPWTSREKLLLRYGGKVPGVQGLKNHGNTCFMNAVVQCLSSTDLLAEYLGLRRYKLDLSPSRTEPRGDTGEVTEQLAALVRALWTLDYTPQLSVDFKVRTRFRSRSCSAGSADGLKLIYQFL